jgi:hypothetical protein
MTRGKRKINLPAVDLFSVVHSAKFVFEANQNSACMRQCPKINR